MQERIEPQPGRQEQFLSTPADIAIYGGAAGGGKTWALLLEAGRNTDIKGFHACVFRRTYNEITNEGGLWDESEKLYPHLYGEGVKGSLEWRFAAGARVEFLHLGNDAELRKYDGLQACLLAFDQLEHFSEKAFFYLAMRNRSTCGIKPYIRATCNPDPDSFLASFLSWWIADDGYADLSRAGVIRWFVRVNEKIVWADTREELESEYADLGLVATSVTFIPATIYDNQRLLAVDPGYLARLMALPLIERERFLGDRQRGGNWKIRASTGKVFNRTWFEIVEHVPEGGVEGRGWDFAASIKSLRNDDPDYTSSVRMRKVGGLYYIIDMTNERIAEGEINTFLLNLSRQDRTLARAEQVYQYIVRWETEPGSSGIRMTGVMTRLLQGFNADGVSATGDKVTKVHNFAQAAEHGKVKLLHGAWNEAFLGAVHGFPDLAHDDIPDAGRVIFDSLEPLNDEPPDQTQPVNPFLKRKNL